MASWLAIAVFLLFTMGPVAWTREVISERGPRHYTPLSAARPLEPGRRAGPEDLLRHSARVHGAHPLPSGRPGTAPPATGTIVKMAAERLALMDRYLMNPAYRQDMERRSRSGDSFDYYFLSYYLHGLAGAFEYTRDPKYLQEAILLIDNVIGAARFSDFNGALPRRHLMVGPFDRLGRPNELYNFQGSAAVARIAALMQGAPDLLDHRGQRYGNLAEHYVDFVYDSTVGPWIQELRGGVIPWINEEVRRWGFWPTWNDKSSHLAMLSAWALQATHRVPGQDLFRDLAQRVAAAFQDKLKPTEAGGWIWDDGAIPIGSDTNDEPGSVGNQAGVPDTAHANREPMMLVTLYEAGLAFTREDIERMARTLTRTIWNGSAADPQFANYINGSNAPYRTYFEPGSNGAVYLGWSAVGRYAPEAQAALEALLDAVETGPRNPTVARNAAGYARISLAGGLLRNLLPLP